VEGLEPDLAEHDLPTHVKVGVRDKAVREAVRDALERLPPEARDVPTLSSIVDRETSESGSLAGLTRRITYERRLRFRSGREGSDEVVVQRIELYRDILRRLSQRARVAVVAHELAHAWLNDNVGPDDSKLRETESDELARKWGFSKELDALSDETY